jgi:hypothetical protein
MTKYGATTRIRQLKSAVRNQNLARFFGKTGPPGLPPRAEFATFLLLFLASGAN